MAKSDTLATVYLWPLSVFDRTRRMTEGQTSYEEIIDQLPPCLPRQHQVYDELIKEKPEVFGKIFEILSDPGELPRGVIKALASKTGIPENTLKTWRKKRKIDPHWLPNHGAPAKPRILTTETEAALKARVIREFISQQEYLNRHRLKMMAYEAWRDQALEQMKQQAYVDYDLLDLENVKVPKFSDVWVKKFEARQGLSYRTPSVARRSKPNDSYVATWLQELEVAFFEYPKSLIWNIDETCLRVVNGKIKTIAIRGSQDVAVNTNFDMKQALTVVAACSCEGKKMPLFVLLKGKTEKCEEKLRQDKRLRHFVGSSLHIDHTEKGWSNHEFAQRYLKALSNHLQKRSMCVLWDLHSSHRKDSVKEYAKKKNIHLSYIPAGQTGYWQPLDRKLFGIVKKQTQAELDRLTLKKSLSEIDMCDVLVILVNVWNSLEEETIQKAWAHIAPE